MIHNYRSMESKQMAIDYVGYMSKHVRAHLEQAVAASQ